MKLYEINEPGTSPLPHQNNDEIVVGIDLGTTNSLVAVKLEKEVKVIDGLLPSIVYFNDEGKIVNSEHKHYASSFKRLIGKKYDNVTLKNDYIVPHYNDLACVKIANKIYTPIELSAEILKQLKQCAEKSIGKRVSKAVITVPAYFDDLQRQATKEAALLAGIDVLRLINEPTAAALAYGLDNKINGHFIIYDLGGGTFDISILNLQDKVFQVIATKGDTNLGGDDFDECIVEYLKKEFEAQESMQQLKEIAKHLKEQLTNCSTASHGQYQIGFKQFKQLTSHLVTKTIKLMHQAINDTDINESQIEGIVLVGGSTRMPIIAEALEENFAIKLYNNLNPDEIVALGAALQAYNLHQGSDNLLIDVLPLSIGIELMGGIVERVIPRNTTIPASVTQEFTTYQNNQTGMIFNIVQGERDLAKDCRSLGRFEIKGIPPMIAGMAKVKVKFMVDADGMLTIMAEETTTNTIQTIHINPSFGLGREQIREMLLESIEFSEQDVKTKLLIETRIDAERLIMTIEDALIKFSVALKPEELSLIEQDLGKLKQATKHTDRELMINLMQQLEKSSVVLAEKQLADEFNEALKGKSLDDLSKIF